MHRDLGQLLIGLTLVYAVSGLAVNHIDDWDPNFRQVETRHRLAPGLQGDAAAQANQVLRQLAVTETPADVYRIDENRFDIVLAERTLHVDRAAGLVIEEGQKARWLVRTANWLHTNRGKRAWTWVADAYAGLLLVLAGTGLSLAPRRVGWRSRGPWLVAVGVVVPIAYVVWSGGP